MGQRGPVMDRLRGTELGQRLQGKVCGEHPRAFEQAAGAALNAAHRQHQPQQNIANHCGAVTAAPAARAANRAVASSSPECPARRGGRGRHAPRKTPGKATDVDYTRCAAPQPGPRRRGQVMPCGSLSSGRCTGAAAVMPGRRRDGDRRPSRALAKATTAACKAAEANDSTTPAVARRRRQPSAGARSAPRRPMRPTTRAAGAAWRVRNRAATPTPPTAPAALTDGNDGRGVAPIKPMAANQQLVQRHGHAGAQHQPPLARRQRRLPLRVRLAHAATTAKTGPAQTARRQRQGRRTAPGRATSAPPP